MFQNLTLSAAQEVRDSSSGVTPCIVMKNDGVLYYQASSFCPESMRLRSLRQSRGTRYNTKDELIRAIERSKRNENKDRRADGVRRLPNIWQKVRGGETILKVHKCCIPVNKVMLEIMNCCHYFFPTIVHYYINPLRSYVFLPSNVTPNYQLAIKASRSASPSGKSPECHP